MPKIIVEGPTAGSHQPIQLTLNQNHLSFPVNTEVTVTAEQLAALKDSDHVIQIIEAETAEAEQEPAPADGGDAGGGGGTGAPVTEALPTVPQGGSADPTPVLPEGFLDRSVKLIVADLADKDLPFLDAARHDENTGKTRATLIAAIDDLIAAQAPPAA